MITYLPPFHASAAPSTPLPLAASRLDPSEIAAHFRAGEPAMQGELMRHYRPRLYAFAYRLTRNHHDAEDLVQETFLRALRAAAGYRGEAALSSWLHTIARNVAHNRYWYWRRRKGDATVSLDAPQVEADDAWRKAIAVDERAATEQHELERCIAQAIDRLPERDRVIVELRTRKHASYEGIARTLGVGVGTVKSRLARARERLRELVDEAGGFEARPRHQES